MNGAYLLNESPQMVRRTDEDELLESKNLPASAISSNVKFRGGSSTAVKEYLRYNSNGEAAGAAAALQDLFLFCAKRLDEHSRSHLLKVMPLDESREELELISTHLMLEYVKQIVNYLVKSKVSLQQKVEEFIKPEEEYMNEYEGMLQKLEAQCRQHINIQQQLKIWAETAEENYESAKKELDIANKLTESLQEQVTNLTSQHSQRGDMINYLKQRVTDLEVHVEKISHLNQIKVTPEALEFENNNLNLNNNNNMSQPPLPNSHRVLQPQLNQPVITSSKENSNSKQQSQQHQIQQEQLLKRTQRSVSTVVLKQQQQHSLENQGTNHNLSLSHNQPRPSNKVSKDTRMQQQENNSNINQQQSLKSLTSNGVPIPYNLQNTQQTSQSQMMMSTNSADALASLLSNSNKKQQHSTSIHSKSVTGTREDSKKLSDRYLFDKGEKQNTSSSNSSHLNNGVGNGVAGGASAIYGEKVARPQSDLSKSGKINNNNNSSRHNRGQSSKSISSSNSSYSATSTQAVLIKAIQQQQILKQVQSQAVMNRIQSMILTGQQSQQTQNSLQGSSGSSNSNKTHGHIREKDSGLVSHTQSSSSKRSLSRSKSRHKFKDEQQPTSMITSTATTQSIKTTGSGGGVGVNATTKEYNIYTVHNSSSSTSQGKYVKSSPMKSKSSDTNSNSKRSLSVDAFSKQANNSKTSLVSKY